MISKIKMCGMTRWEDVNAAAACGAEFIGFIHSDASKRNISMEKITRLILKLKKTYPKIKSVCVVTTEQIEEIDHIVAKTNCDYIQVHNDMDVTEFNKTKSPGKIKVFRISEENQPKLLEHYHSDFFLWDTYSSNLSGGTGEKFNWNLIPKQYLSKSFVAGGVNDKNISELIKNYHPYAVDVSSSLELRPGIKSKVKIKKLFNVIKQDHITGK